MPRFSNISPIPLSMCAFKRLNFFQIASVKLPLEANTCILLHNSSYMAQIKLGIPPFNSHYWENLFEPVNVLFTPSSEFLLYTFTLESNLSPPNSDQDFLGYRHTITKRISWLDFPFWEHWFSMLNVAFAPFSMSLLHTFTLWQNCQSLTHLPKLSSYRPAIVK